MTVIKPILDFKRVAYFECEREIMPFNFIWFFVEAGFTPLVYLYFHDRFLKKMPFDSKKKF